MEALFESIRQFFLDGSDSTGEADGQLGGVTRPWLDAGADVGFWADVGAYFDGEGGRLRLPSFGGRRRLLGLLRRRRRRAGGRLTQPLAERGAYIHVRATRARRGERETPMRRRAHRRRRGPSERRRR